MARSSERRRCGRPKVAISAVVSLVVVSMAPLVAGVSPAGALTTTTVDVGSSPWAVDVNPVTNRIYVANTDSSTVSVIDGSTNTVTTIDVGDLPAAVGVNPATDKIYVANANSDTVSVIDGSTNAVTSVGVGVFPRALAVNVATDKVYVADEESNTVSVIDGNTNVVTPVGVGVFPAAVEVNPATDKIYVVNGGSNTVSVIDGNTNTVATVHVGSFPMAVEVNPATDKIYVANYDADTVSVIDGATNAVTSVDVGEQPIAVRANSVTDKIYVANTQSNTVSVIDGDTNVVTSVDVGRSPYDVGVNPTTDKVYVANAASNSVSVIDGHTNAVTSVDAGDAPIALAVNAVTSSIYVTNLESDTVTVIVQAGVSRIYGQDAIDTSIATSRASFPGADSARGAVLARSDYFTDALGGGPLAARVKGPLLITPGASESQTLDPRVQTELQRVLPRGAPVYLVGGPLALSPSIEATLSGLGFRVQRLFGETQYGTAVAIAGQLGNPSTVFETTGLSFYDSLSAVPAVIGANGAILLTDGAIQAPETAAYLAAHPNDTRYAIGGPLAAAGADPQATAVWGQDLYGTSAAVGQRFFPSPNTFAAATSANFSDAFGAGPMLGQAHAPMLLVPPSGTLPAPITSYLSSVAAGLVSGTVFGGPLAVGDDVLAQLNAIV